MSVKRYTVNLGDITLHIKDATSIGGKIIIRYSENEMTKVLGCPLLESDEFDVTPQRLRSKSPPPM